MHFDAILFDMNRFVIRLAIAVLAFALGVAANSLLRRDAGSVTCIAAGQTQAEAITLTYAYYRALDAWDKQSLDRILADDCMFTDVRSGETGEPRSDRTKAQLMELLTYGTRLAFDDPTSFVQITYVHGNPNGTVTVSGDVLQLRTVPDKSGNFRDESDLANFRHTYSHRDGRLHLVFVEEQDLPQNLS
jgi:hypothetical protein